MFYIIQENTFNEIGHDRLLETLSRLSLGYEIIKVKPFVEELEFDTDRKDVFVFGGLKLSRLAKNYNWDPGTMLNSNHDFMVYKNYYGDNLLNFDSKVFKLSEEIPFMQSEYFMRPCKDNKALDAKIYNASSWKQFKEDVVSGKIVHDGLDNNTLVQVSSLKRIQKEYRFWTVDGKPVTGSQYKSNGRYFIKGDVDQNAWEFCQDMASVYQLSDAFVMDICMTEGDYKIVECGCINSAGFYNADMNKLVISLEELFSKGEYMSEVILKKDGFYFCDQGKVMSSEQFLTGWHKLISIEGEVTLVDLIDHLEELSVISVVELLLDCNIKTFFKELRQESKEESSIVKIQVSKHFELSEEMLDSTFCSGILKVPFVEENTNITYDSQGLEFTAWNEIKNVVLEISKEGKFYEGVDVPQSEKEVYAPMRLGEFLYGLFDELSFFGDPSHRDSQLSSLNKTIKDIKSGACKMILWEDVDKELKNIKDKKRYLK